MLGISWLAQRLAASKEGLCSMEIVGYLTILSDYLRVLINLWLSLFAAQPKEFFLNGIKKLEQRSHKCVELRGNM
jgi:hypothetical protein